MEKILNQRIHEIPLDIKQAIYDRGYDAGRQSILEQEEAKWIPAESSRYGSMYAGAKCSNCGGGVDGYVSIHFKFCPFCGKLLGISKIDLMLEIMKMMTMMRSINCEYARI